MSTRALVAALLLASAWKGDTRPGDDFLTAAVIPSAAPASSGALITVAGINFNPGGVFGSGGGGTGGFDDNDDDDYDNANGGGGAGYGGTSGMACVFGGDEGRGRVALTPGCPLGYLQGHTGCRQLNRVRVRVLTHNNKRGNQCARQP